MAKRSGCPAKGKRPSSNPFLHGVCLTSSSYPACVCAGVSSSPRPVQAQRRRVIYIRGRTRGCAGWRHKCLIRPTSPFAGSNSVGTRKHSATGRYTSDAVPAVVPDGGINALSGLRVLHRLKQRRPAQAQRRRAGGSSMESPDAEKQKPAFWAGSLNSGARTRTNAAGVEQRACRAGPEGVSRCAANNRTEFDGESGRRKAKTRLLGGFFK